jgi:surface polysaccharide O-acyltransferase-like enzyme
MKISEKISRRIEFARSMGIVAIVIRHSSLDNWGYPKSGIATADPAGYAVLFISNLFSEIVGRVAVPIFFCVSGYLFFNNYEPSVRSYVGKIKSRLHGLLVPYLFWNLALLLFLLTIQSIPFFAPYFSGSHKPIRDYTILNYLDAFIAFENGYPISYQFWFIRDLLILILISPAIYILARRATIPGLAMLILPWMCGYEVLYGNVRFESLIFFYVGCLIIIRRKDLSFIDDHRGAILLSYLVLSALLALYETSGMQTFSYHLNQIVLVLGVAAFWSITGVAIQTGVHKMVWVLSAYSFFVFATHEPVLEILRKLLIRFRMPATPLDYLAYYILLPVVTIFMTLVAARLLESYANGLYKLTTGGRTKRH